MKIISVWGLFLPCILFASDANAQTFLIDLFTDNVIPKMCQVRHGTYDNRCGAAISQMALMGYPNGVNFPVDQEVAWSNIQARNLEGNLYWTDPMGLRSTLQSFGPIPNGSWEIFPDPDPASLMFDIAFWMEARRYPVPTMIGMGDHWVLITGLIMDAPASTTNPIVLRQVDILEPQDPYCPYPDAGGVSVNIPEAIWNSPTSGYWNGKITYPTSRWKGKYVAVIEPPTRKGTVKFGKPQKDGGPLILPKDAVKVAQEWLDSIDKSANSSYKTLRYAEVLDPSLVNGQAHAYYLAGIGDGKSGIADGVVLINAYSGELQETGVFSRGRRYLSRESAWTLLEESLKMPLSEYDDSNFGELFFESSDQIQSRLFPAWRFRIENAYYFVTQWGGVFKKLTRTRGGN